MRRHAAQFGAGGGVRGRASGSYVEDTLVYASTIDPSIDDLNADYCYDPGYSNQPILLLQHGYTDVNSNIVAATRRRFAALGFCSLLVNMRGRGAGGTRDSSAREIHDILDAEDALLALVERLDPLRMAGSGYSGGGGNMFALGARAPDRHTVLVSHYGISSYSTWHGQYAPIQAQLESDVGGDPSEVPGSYSARESRAALPHQLALGGALGRPGPFLYMFHDEDDGAVPVEQSDAVRDALDDAGLGARFEYHRSTSLDSERYLHGYPEGSAGVKAAEAYWWKHARDSEAWVVPPRGRVLVNGAIVTRRFQVWLGSTGGTNPKTDADGGTLGAARVDYDVEAGTFDVLAISGAMKVRCEVGGDSVTDDLASGELLQLSL